MATQSRIGWRPYVTQVVNAVDADATAFIAAAGITNLTQAAAISTLVNDLKTYGLWTKMKALYPMVGGSAASHKFNLKDPRDLDAAFRLVFNGGWIHSSNGALPNGTTGYADTFFIPSTNLGAYSVHLSYYSKTNRTYRNSIAIGAWQDSPTHNTIDLRLNGNNAGGNGYSVSAMFDGWNGLDYASYATTRSDYFLIGSKTAINLNKVYENGALKGTNTTTSTRSIPNVRVLIGAEGRGTTGATNYDNLESAFASIGDGLTDTEASNFYTSVQKFQTTLGRHVGTPYVSDTDAIAFLMAAGITDGTQAAAINTLVIRMKADGVWTKMRAIYPFVGGTANSHKFNLKDPRDLDAAYRLVFNGGITHTYKGVLFNGTTGYADTKLTPNIMSLNSQHMSFYTRIEGSTQMGVAANGYNFIDTFDATTFRSPINLQNYTLVSSTISSRIGFFIGNRNTSTNISIYKDVNKLNDNFIGSQYLETYPIYISGLNRNTSINVSASNEYIFSTIGDGLTDIEAKSLYNSVQAFQTTLGRQVNIPLVSDTDAQSFLNAANITSFQQASAVNKLVIDLKATGVWTKMKAIYPFVGGSATSHKWNLKDPRDLDAAYRLVFNGGWTHTGTGALPNGTTGYANTYFNLQSLKQNDTHLSIYNTNNFTPISNGSIDMGAYQESGPNTSGAFIATEIATNLSRARLFFNALDYTATDNRGYYIVNSNSTNNQYFINNVSRSSIANSGFFPLINKNIFIGALNGTSFLDGAYYYSNGLYTFSSIGDGLTDAEATSLYTAVQTYQTSLGRAVNTPVYNNGLVLNLDAGNANSYPGTGTTWFDLASGNNGTLVNGPTYDTTNGGSILFDGVNDRISTFPTQFPNNGSKTIDVWFKTTSTVRQGLCGTRDTLSTGWVFTINRTTSGRLTYFHTGSGTAEFVAGITTNTWYNAVATHDSTTGLVKIYLNGSLIGSANVGVIYSSSFNGVIGDEDSTVPSTPFKGNIPKVTIYNKVLTDTEILNNFNSTRGRFGL